ncbi:unnamed protein product [Bursaphelenchus okinawaensis]|uniref:N-acyl-aliphatic-L-amino acid amidohydrolase n=1 Tax=Bursaphelenchus okinawaensis TaxID=465554 RepID=A0A811L2T6_9BILA|nr:unnamed protein product [Bursaphelenchus okinawaensis]CAG9115578.1 unnamed protein product [Bursaphelenchus okinawaensis]
MDELAIKRFQQYLQVNTEQPTPDYEKSTTFLIEYANELGFETWTYECVKGKPFVGMVLKGSDPSLPSVMLYSHTDVVPTFPGHWKYDPYSAHRDEKGDIYARGAQDMKCVGVQYMEALRRLIKEGKTFKRTIHLVWGPEEEVGGIDGMALFAKTEKLKSLNIGFILDEGLATEDDAYKVYYGERCPWWIKVTCSGSPGHGSKFIENTAGEKLQSIINSFLAFREEQRLKLANNPDLKLGDVTTVNLTKIEGGVQQNVLPAEFIAYFDIRVTPTVDFEAFEKQIQEWCTKAGPGVKCEFLQKCMVKQLTPTTKDDPWWNAFSSVMDELNCKISKEIFVGATDSRYLREQGYKSIGFSPMINTPQLLHDHNEYLNDKVFLRGGFRSTKNFLERLANV